MKTLLRDEANKLWKKYWDEAKTSFFKVEAEQDYSAEENLQNVSYTAWQRGDKDESVRLMKEQAQAYTEHIREKPILKQRVHIVEHPYSSYLEWEILHYEHANIPYGDEEVYLVDADVISEVTIPGDFMIFDDLKVVNSHYNSEGLMTHRDFYDENDDVSEFIYLRNLLLSKATRL
jgi:hypothetical protein